MIQTATFQDEVIHEAIIHQDARQRCGKATKSTMADDDQPGVWRNVLQVLCHQVITCAQRKRSYRGKGHGSLMIPMIRSSTLIIRRTEAS
jgi:hypothetical protein